MVLGEYLGELLFWKMRPRQLTQAGVLRAWEEAGLSHRQGSINTRATQTTGLKCPLSGAEGGQSGDKGWLGEYTLDGREKKHNPQGAAYPMGALSHLRQPPSTQHTAHPGRDSPKGWQAVTEAGDTQGLNCQDKASVL